MKQNLLKFLRVGLRINDLAHEFPRKILGHYLKITLIY